MRAVILSADRNENFGDRPLVLAGKPLLARQLAALRFGGVNDIGVVRSFGAEQIAFPNITYFESTAATGAVASLAAAAEWLRNGPVLVSHGNSFYRREIVHAMASVRGSFVVAHDRKWRDLWVRRFGDKLAHAETFRRTPSGVMQDIGGKATDLDSIQGRYIGLLKFTPGSWQTVEALLAGLDPAVRERLDITGLLQRLLAAQALSIGTVGTDGQCGEIDTPDDEALYDRMAAAGELALEG